MSENVRFIKAENIAEKLSVINDRTYAYCETEEEQFQEIGRASCRERV